jgi:hypothetical protein
MKKRIFALILALAAVSSCFVSCGSTGSTYSGSPRVHSLGEVLEYLKMKENTEERIPVTKVEITNKNYEESETWGKYVVLEPGKTEYQINYKAYPDNATVRTASLFLQASPADCATIDKDGLITFTKPGLAKVIAEADDGSGVYDTFTVILTQ